MSRTQSRTARPGLGNLLHAWSAITVAAALLATASTAHAEKWRFSITPYAWATDVGVSAKIGERQLVDQTIAVSDLLQDLDTIFQMKLEASRGSFGLMLDVFDVTLSDQMNDVALPQNAGTADLGSDMGMTILDVAAMYDPKGDRQGLGFMGGTRILNERATIDATYAPSGGSPVVRTHETNDTMVDALIGARYTKRFGRQWSVQMQADASTGGTDYTWSAGPTLSYAFGTLNRYGVNVGYRHMVVDFQNTQDLDTEMTLSGVVLGFRASF